MNLPGYQAVEPVHSGRRHLVLRARRQRDGAGVVLKTAAAGVEQPALAAGIRREHALLVSLGLDGIGEALALEETPAGPALVLRDAGPHSLQRWLGHRPMEVPIFLDFGAQMARTVAELHRRACLHRDLNPSNFVVGGDGKTLTLVDFDTATRVPGMFHARGVAPDLDGTLPYLAPEQSGRMHRPVDQRADLYSLGVTFYEMLTGTLPFPSSDPAEVVHAHLARLPTPPASVHPAVPRPLSDLVLKLLAKAPEERYQTADALVADVEEARQRWRARGTIGPFELGRSDLLEALPIPDRLYGRAGELSQLMSALEAARAGSRELVVIAGPAGVGKSVLAGELVRAAPARAVCDKFDQQRGNLPYAALVDGFRRFCGDIAGRPAAERARWCQRLAEALGRNAPVVSELVPELGPLVPETPPVPVLGALETETRLHLTFSALVRALAAEARPLVVILDDVQWADSASLKLLQLIVTDPEIGNLMVVTTVRPEEAQTGHPWAATLAAIQSAGGAVRELDLRPLDAEALTALCSDTLARDPDRVRPLAELLLRLTAGNPFFVKRLLRFVHQRSLVSYDLERGEWTWDLPEIETLEVTENVVELMLAAMDELAPGTRRLLGVAACLRGRVDLWLLSAVLAQPGSETTTQLWEAIREGFLVPDEKGRRFGARETDEATAPEASYRFAHDRLRQAARSLLSEQESNQIRLALGRRLRGGLRPDDPPERLFEVADLLNAAAHLLTDASERLRLLRLNRDAGARAKAAAAYGPALGYFTRGLDLLESTGGMPERELRFCLLREATECAYLNGQQDLADGLAEAALAAAASPVEQADIYNIRVIACATRPAPEEAIEWGRKGLALFGLVLPTGDLQAAAGAEFGAITLHLEGRTLDEVLDLPRTDDPRICSCLSLLANLVGPSYIAAPPLFGFLVGRMINLSLQHGNSVYSAFAYAAYGMILAGFQQDYVTAHAFGRLGVDLARRFDDPVQECRTLHVFASFVNHWRAPLKSSLALLRRAIERGLEGGELQFSAYAGSTLVVVTGYSGAALPTLAAEAESSLALALRSHTQAAWDYVIGFRQLVRCLEGRTRERGRFDDDSFDEAAHLASASSNAVSVCLYYVARLQAAYLFGDLSDAREMSRAAGGHIGALLGLVPVVEHTFYTSLTLAGLCGTADEAERRELLDGLSAGQAQLAAWAEHSPENYLPKHLIVSGELAWLQGRPAEATELFDRAIDEAHQRGTLQDEAVACLLAARHHRARGHRRHSELYLRAAHETFVRWGASGVAAALEVSHPELGSERGTALPTLPRLSAAVRDDAIDLLSLLKAAETISSEVVMDQLLQRLMGVCLEVAGATRGALVREEEGMLVVRAVGSVAQGVRCVRTPHRLSTDIPRRLVELAFANEGPIIVGDVSREPRLADDPCVAASGARAALVIPIRQKAKPVGVLYLENQLVTFAFSPERVRLLSLLSSQIAISLENSLLFEKLNIEVEERRRAENSVRFLADAGVLLHQSLDYQATLGRLARLGVPLLADWCVVEVMEDEGDEVSRIGAHVDPAREALLYDSRVIGSSGLVTGRIASTVMASGTPWLWSASHPEAVAALAEAPALRAVAQALEASTISIAPLVARGKPLGIMVLGSGPRRAAPDRLLAEEVARRAALAVDNARLYREAQRSIRLRDEFLSIASHELNTPFTGLRLAVQALAAGTFTGTPETQQRAYDILERQTRRLVTLTGELLDVSRIQARTLRLKREPCDLVTVVVDVGERFEAQLAEARCTLVLDTRDRVVGRWDRGRLEQVVTNLLSNALKFGAGKPIRVSVEPLPERARLTVADEGIGIEPDRLHRIFERFERAVSATHYGGLGLGLYIAREIVVAHGGSITVDSTPGMGAVFIVELPRAATGQGDNQGE